MSRLLRSMFVLLALTLVAAACGDDADDTTADPESVPEADAPAGAADPEDASLEAEDVAAEADSVEATVAALVVRSVPGDVDAFTSSRDAYVADLESQPGIVHDREFLPFLSFLTFAAPQPPVYIGLTSGATLPEFGASADAVAADLVAAYFPTFDIEVFGILQPLDSATPVDISAIATEPGQVLEIAWRDLAAYEGFDQADYEVARDAYLAELASMDGFVEEYQWVSADGGTLAVGMTVYESADAFQAIATDADFTASDVYGAFVGGFPIAGGYASTVLK